MYRRIRVSGYSDGRPIRATGGSASSLRRKTLRTVAGKRYNPPKFVRRAARHQQRAVKRLKLDRDLSTRNRGLHTQARTAPPSELPRRIIGKVNSQGPRQTEARPRQVTMVATVESTHHMSSPSLLRAPPGVREIMARYAHAYSCRRDAGSTDTRNGMSIILVYQNGPGNGNAGPCMAAGPRDS